MWKPGSCRWLYMPIHNLYVDSTNMDKLVEDAIVGMLENLILTPNIWIRKRQREMNEPLQGNFDGSVYSLICCTDTLYVIQVIAGGPSEKVGLTAGDRIIMVNDTVVAGV